MPTASTPGAPLLARTFSHAPQTRRLSISNDFTLGCGLSVGSSPCGLACGRPDLSGPFTRAPLQGRHRYYGPVRPCAPPRYSAPQGVGPSASSLSRPGGPIAPISTGRHYRGDRFSCSVPAPATSSRHLYTGHHQDSKQAASWLTAHPNGHAYVPGTLYLPGFGAIVRRFDASAVVHSRSSSRRTPDPLSAGLFRNAHNPGSLPAQLAVVWGLRLLGDPGGPPSITGTARFMLTTFYIVTTPLSGRTTEPAICRAWSSRRPRRPSAAPLVLATGSAQSTCQGRDHSVAHPEAINVRTPRVPGVPQACHTGRWLEVDNGYRK